MKDTFAKLYEADDIGQVLLRTDSDDDYCPCICISFHVPAINGIADMKLSYADDDGGWELRDKIFNEMNETKALDVARKQIKGLSND